MLQIFQKMITLASMMLLGYIANKANVMDEISNKKLSALIINITLPCMMLASLGTSTASTAEIGMMLGIALVFYGVFILLALIVPKLFGASTEDTPLFRFFTVFTNNGYMGFPVVKMIYGSSALVYAAVINIPVNLLMFSYGVLQFAGKQEAKHQFDWRTLINVPIISALITLVLALLQFRFSGVVQNILNPVGDMTVPLSMLVVGSSLAMQPIRQVLSDGKSYVFAVFRLIFCPVLIWALLYFVPVKPLIKGIFILIAGMPCAANGVVFAQQYEGDAVLASRYVFVTTILSVFAIPLISYLLL